MASASCYIQFKSPGYLPSDGDPVAWKATDGDSEYDITIAIPAAEPSSPTFSRVGSKLDATVTCDDAGPISSGKRLWLITQSGHTVGRSVAMLFVPPA